MSDHNENKHAAGAEGCQLNGVQFPLSDADIERLQSAAAYDGILLTRSSILIGAEKHDDLPQVIRQELGRLFPQTILIKLVQHLCQQAGLSEILTKVSLSQLQRELFGILSSRLAHLHPGDVQTEVLIGWCSQEPTFESPLCCVDKNRMDDGGRRGNAPPNAANAKIPEKQPGVVG